MKYDFMEEHGQGFCVRRMCQVLGVSPSGFYAWRNRPKSKRQRANEELLEHVKVAHEETGRRTYGSPRVTYELHAQGIVCGHNRVARLMRKHGIRAKMKRRFKATTRSDARRPAAPNLLEQTEPVQANEVWVSDITYIRTGEGWIYLCIVMDLVLRKIVGWALKPYLTTALTLQALRMACGRAQPGADVIFHSDRGSQYSSHAFVEELALNGFVQSMTGKGYCFDNAHAESFFHSLKTEEVQFQLYTTRDDATASIFDYIEVFYHRVRRHTALGYMSPADYELALAA